MTVLTAEIITAFSLISLFLPFPAAASENLLGNGDFEEFVGDLPDKWSKNVSTLTVSPSAQTQNGLKSSQLVSSTSSTKYLFQIIPLTPGDSYHLAGWGKILSGTGNEFLRVSTCSDTSCESTKTELSVLDSAHNAPSDWLEFSLNFVAPTGVLAGKIKAGLDPAGTGNVISLWDNLRLEKVIPVSTPSPAAASPVPTVNEPAIEFSPPGNLPVGTTFSLPVQIRGLEPGNYYLKIRLGPDADHLTHGQTYNADWLADNSAWTNFPRISPTNGSWQGSINARLPNEEPSGTFKILVRLKNADRESFTQSGPREITFLPPETKPDKKNSPTQAATTVPRLSSKPSPVTSPVSLVVTPSSLVLGTFSGQSNSSPAAGPKLANNQSPEKFRPPPEDNYPVSFSDVVISAGLFLFGFAAVFFVRSKL